jgi:hypothetical protein
VHATDEVFQFWTRIPAEILKVQILLDQSLPSGTSPSKTEAVLFNFWVETRCDDGMAGVPFLSLDLLGLLPYPVVSPSGYGYEILSSMTDVV